jgi:ketosteroid isomerase-like protein
MRAVVAVVLAAVASATLAADRSAELSQLVATEREFAARAQQVNARQAFVEYFAANAILFNPFASPAFPELREGPDWGVNIQWRPVAAAISGAGDMGFTTGPSEYRRSPAEPPLRHGHYTSVWQREPDGRYRVLIDIGIFHAAPSTRVDDGSLRSAPARPAQDANDQAAAVTTLLEVDRHMGTAARASAAARLTMMAADVRLHVAGQIPAVGRAEALTLLEALDHRYEWSPEGAAVAISADFGFTYGRGRWRRNEPPASGELAYLNVWQRDAGEWRLIVHVCNRIEPPP